MKVLLTGGAGFIGSHLADAMLAQGHEVVVVDNLTTGKREHLNAGARFWEVDIRDSTVLAEVFRREKPDVVSHHAAQVGVRKSMTEAKYDAEVNILGSLNVIDCAICEGVRKFVFASTSALYANMASLPVLEEPFVRPISAYGLSKYVVEQYLDFYHRTLGLSYTAFRYGNVYGPRQDPHGECGVVAIFSEQILLGIQPTIFGDGKKTRDYVYIQDVVEANLLALEATDGCGAFNVGHGREISDSEVFEYVRAALGVSIEPIYVDPRAGELPRVALDSSKAARFFGWRPKVSFAEGIAATTRHSRTVFSRRPAEATLASLP